MVVLGINPCNEGCTGRINLGILQVARENGHEVYSGIGPYGKRIEKDIPQITIGNKIILRINNLIDNYLGGQKYVAYLSTFLFLKKLKKIKPDIIHIHVVVGNYINLKMLFKYAEANKIKLVWTMHDAWALTGRCAYFELNGCNKWKTGCNNCEYKKQYPVEKIDSSRRNYEYKKKIFADQSCLTIVTPSTWLKN